MEKHGIHRQAIEQYIVIRRYIVARQPPAVWTCDEERYRYLFLSSPSPFFIPKLEGIPSNCLPLLSINRSREIIGILTDTRVLSAQEHTNESNVDNIQIYANFKEMFEKKLALYNQNDTNIQMDYYLVRVVGLIDEYKYHVRTLRRYYPDISSLLIDPPNISLELRKTSEVAEGWADLRQ